MRTKNVGKYNGLLLKDETIKRSVFTPGKVDKSFNKENQDPEDMYNFSVFQPNLNKKKTMLDILVQKEENPEK